jgi:hypothetical protein
MTITTGEFIHLSLRTLSRRPLLTAMMVFLAAFGMAAFAVWREISGNSNPQRAEFLYLVRIGAEVAVTEGNRHAKTTLGYCDLGAGRRFAAGPW